MDQALEKAYDKPAKGPSGIIDVTCKKDSVLQWNVIKHEKGRYKNFLYDVYYLSDEDKYSLHHEFSADVTAFDETSVTLLMNEILKRVLGS